MDGKDSRLMHSTFISAADYDDNITNHGSTHVSREEEAELTILQGYEMRCTNHDAGSQENNNDSLDRGPRTASNFNVSPLNEPDEEIPISIPMGILHLPSNLPQGHPFTPIGAVWVYPDRGEVHLSYNDEIREDVYDDVSQRRHLPTSENEYIEEEQAICAYIVEDPGDLPHAEPIDDTFCDWLFNTRKGLKTFAAISFITCAIAVAIVYLIRTTQKNPTNISDKSKLPHVPSSPNSSIPSDSLSTHPSESPSNPPSYYFVPSVILAVSDQGAFQDRGSPQFRALKWLVEEDESFDLSWPDDRIIQRYVLAVLYFSTGGENWRVETGFLSNTHECDWELWCLDGTQIVDGILLPGIYMSGHIPDEVGFLKLSVISLPGNHLSGTLPFTVGRLARLSVLDLDGNSLTGSIPSSLGMLTKMNVLILFGNFFTGSIPEDLGNLKEIIYFRLGFNSLNGTIPSFLNSLTKLKVIDLGMNTLTGTIPPLTSLEKLKDMYIDGNYISGIIPTSIGNLTNLRKMRFSRNHLNGSIPLSIGALKKIVYISLDSNQLTGIVPLVFSQLPIISTIKLENNNLTGSINFLCQNSAIYSISVDMNEVYCPCCDCCN